ncbi:MAG: hypothetical protein R6U89_08480 [Dehalococcoidia bacterium]
MDKSGVARLLVVGVMAIAILSVNPVLADDDDDWSDAMEWFSDLAEEAGASTGGSGGGGSGDFTSDDYNPQSDMSGGACEEPPYHPICPGCVGDLTLEANKDIRVIQGMHTVDCKYVGGDGYSQRVPQAEFSIAWAEDDGVIPGLMDQLCWPDYIGWDEWWESDKAVSVPNVYLHDDRIDLKGELKNALKEALARAEARAISCDGSETVSPSEIEDPSDNGGSRPQGEFVPSGPFGNDCSIDEEAFDSDWMDYSDFDERIPFESRSYEVQQYHNTLDRASELMLEAYLLERDMEIDRNMRKEMRNLRDALNRNLKQNLIKSFIRLTWLTYDTVKAGVARGRSYAAVVTDAEATGLQQVLAVTNFVNENMPADSAIAINTQTTSGKFMAVGAKGVLDAMGEFAGGNFSSMGMSKSAATVGSNLFGETLKQSGVLPSSPELTDEEFDILRSQYERTRTLDKALARSYRINAERRDRIGEIETEVEGLLDDAYEWEAEEKERVRIMLEDDCQRQKERFEEGL